MMIGYARVSTQDQHPELQVDALKTAGCAQVFHEKITGKLAARTELDACLRTPRKDDTQIVWKLDRFVRSLKSLVEVIHTIEQRGVAFRSLTESIDTSSAGGKLIFHVFGALAEFEHGLIRERTMAWLTAVRARGRRGGRKNKLSANDLMTHLSQPLLRAGRSVQPPEPARVAPWSRTKSS